jgi:hypothetical protein
VSTCRFSTLSYGIKVYTVDCQAPSGLRLSSEVADHVVYVSQWGAGGGEGEGGRGRR